MRAKAISLAIASVALILPLWVNAAVITLASDLSPANEVPPVTVPAPNAVGTAGLILDTDTGNFSWLISFAGLTGPATAAHFHRGAVGMSGDVMIDLDSDPGVDFSGVGQQAGFFAGSTTLSPMQVSDILSNLWYINIHTDANQPGELRGQIFAGTFVPQPIPLPAAAWLIVPGLLGLFGFSAKRRR